MGTPERDEEIVRFFMQHVVAVNQAWDQPGISTRQQNAYTCFVLDMWGEWFLVTAGHVLLEHLYSPERKNVACSIYDAWKKGASQHPIPFSLPERRFALDQDGLDLGLIPLDPFYRRQLAANGIKAFDESVAAAAAGHAPVRGRRSARPPRSDPERVASRPPRSRRAARARHREVDRDRMKRRGSDRCVPHSGSPATGPGVPSRAKAGGRPALPGYFLRGHRQVLKKPEGALRIDGPVECWPHEADRRSSRSGACRLRSRCNSTVPLRGKSLEEASPLLQRRPPGLRRARRHRIHRRCGRVGSVAAVARAIRARGLRMLSFLRAPVAYAIAMGIANVCYLLGPLAEILVQPQNPERLRRWLYGLGVAFSVMLPWVVPMNAWWEFFSVHRLQ